MMYSTSTVKGRPNESYEMKSIPFVMRTISYFFAVALLAAPVSMSQDSFTTAAGSEQVKAVQKAVAKAKSPDAIENSVHDSVKALGAKPSREDVNAVVSSAIASLKIGSSNPGREQVMAVVNGAVRALGKTEANFSLVASFASAALIANSSISVGSGKGGTVVVSSDKNGTVEEPVPADIDPDIISIIDNDAGSIIIGILPATR